MEMGQSRNCLGFKLLGVVFSTLLLLVANSAAAESIVANWNLNNVDQQTRKLTSNFSGDGSVIGAGSRTGDVSNSSLTIDGLTVTTEDNPSAAYLNGSDFVAGGAVYQATASSNMLTINNSTIQGRNLFGGAALLNNVDNRLGTASANDNAVLIKDSTIGTSSLGTGGDVYGGVAMYGHGSANNNSVTIDNSTVSGDVFGGFVNPTLIDGVDRDPETQTALTSLEYHADNNAILIRNGSTINGNVYGSFAMSPSGNTITIDNSTVVGSVLGGYDNFVIHDSSGSVSGSKITNNTISILNGSTVADAVVASGKSIPAFNNTLIVDNSNVSDGQLITAAMDLWLAPSGQFYNAAIYNNNLEYRNVSSATSMKEIGAALNLSGTANNNTALLSNLADLTVLPPTESFGVLDINALRSQNLFSIKNLNGNLQDAASFNPSYGFIYGGASMQYNSQTNDNDTIPTPDAEGHLDESFTTVPAVTRFANGGTNSDGNTVTLVNSNVKANIMGGFSGEIEDINYTTWQYTPASGSTPANYKKTVVVRNGANKITTEYDCGSTGSSCTVVSTNSEEVSFSEYDQAVYSASDNTVILEDSQLDGTVYGGFVIGADLKADKVQTANNTVVLRGNTTLTNDSVIYGGNSAFGHTTNKLIFDHISDGNGGFVTYNSKDQFQNFNEVWQINANLDTRIKFDFSGVSALVNVDRSAGEGSAMIIQAQTAVDISGVEQNGVISDLTDTSVELVQQREGVYSYSLTPTKQGANQVGWILNSTKDHANAEVYGQLPLTGLAVASEGAEMLSRAMSNAWQSEEEQSSFLNGGFHHTRYITGSGFDLNSGLAQAGFWKKMTSDWMGGFFVKYAGGHYKTFPIEAKGDVSAYGGGLMSSLRYSDTGRFEASAQAGYMKLKFRSSDLLSTLDSNTGYYGATVGLIENPLNNLELFTQFQFLRKMADDLTDSLDQKIHYKAVQSLALSAGLNYQFSEVDWKGVVPLVGISGLYEFDGESKVEVEGLNDNTASLKGMSAKAEVGILYENQETLLPVTSSLTVFGQAGKRRGFGGEVNISFQF